MTLMCACFKIILFHTEVSHRYGPGPGGDSHLLMHNGGPELRQSSLERDKSASPYTVRKAAANSPHVQIRNFTPGSTNAVSLSAAKSE